MMRLWPRLRRVGRTMLVCSALSTLVLLLFVRGVHAELQHRLWRVGEVLEPLAGAGDPSGDPRTLVVNGAEIVMRSETTSASIGDVLEAAEAECAGYRVGSLSSTIRSETAHRGFVACFSRLRDLSASDARAVVRQYLASGDLTGLGPFSYTYARATRTGTHRLHATFGGLDLGRMIPSKGDAPGIDLPGIPRPTVSRRLFSAFQVDSAYHLAVYTGTPGTRTSVRAAYQDQLEALGWTTRLAPTSGDHDALIALRAGRMVVLTFRASEGNVTTMVASGL